jgi:hypothetical protein
MGISQDEMDEAANLAISFSGCTGMMFYSETVRDLDCCSSGPEPKCCP